MLFVLVAAGCLLGLFRLCLVLSLALECDVGNAPGPFEASVFVCVFVCEFVCLCVCLCVCVCACVRVLVAEPGLILLAVWMFLVGVCFCASGSLLRLAALVGGVL